MYNTISLLYVTLLLFYACLDSDMTIIVATCNAGWKLSPTTNLLLRLTDSIYDF
jgi:hypothetical protein